MPAKKPYKVDIDVVPYLSIMAIVLKLICLILIVMVMRIAINPDALKVIRYEKLWQPPEEAETKTNSQGGSEKQISREPVYIDCHPDRVEIQPEGKVIQALELSEKNGTFETVIRRLESNSSNEFAIIIARPNSAPIYRFVRRQIAARKLTVGYDVLEGDVIIDWAKALKDLAVNIADLQKRKEEQAAINGQKKKQEEKTATPPAEAPKK